MTDNNYREYRQNSNRRRQKNRKLRGLLKFIGFLLLLVIAAMGGYKFMSLANPPEQAAPAPLAAKQSQEQVQPEASSAQPADGQTKSSAATGHDYTILVKKSEFKLYVLDHGQVVETWGVALGKNQGQKKVAGDMKTPAGTFKIDEIDDASTWTHDFGDGKGVINNAYGPWFLSLDTDKLSGGSWGGIGIHGTHDPTSIGKCATEGCIRLNNENLRKLKQQYAKVGMQVTIQD